MPVSSARSLKPGCSESILFILRFTITLVVTVGSRVIAAVPAGSQSALHPASSQAAGITQLWWYMLVGATLIFLLVIALLGYGLWQARNSNTDSELGYLASRNLVLGAGVALPLVVVIFLVGGSLRLGSTLATVPPPNALTIEVTGWRWWWEVRYLDMEGEIIVTTANEIHIPVDRPIKLRLLSEDVIHSFWVPELHGKTDLIPGRENTSWFQAEREGIYRGQCAEFCGVQHALMAFLVVAESPENFQQWLEREQLPTVEPQTPGTEMGARVFMQAGCAACHTIRGTEATGTTGPDLTHLGSRLTLAAVTRPNTIGHLGGWIIDPQNIKPGNLMPETSLAPEQLTALVNYLRSLE